VPVVPDDPHARVGELGQLRLRRPVLEEGHRQVAAAAVDQPWEGVARQQGTQLGVLADDRAAADAEPLGQGRLDAALERGHVPFVAAEEDVAAGQHRGDVLEAELLEDPAEAVVPRVRVARRDPAQQRGVAVHARRPYPGSAGRRLGAAMSRRLARTTTMPVAEATERRSSRTRTPSRVAVTGSARERVATVPADSRASPCWKST